MSLVAQNFESRVQVFMQQSRDLYLESLEIERLWFNLVSAQLTDKADTDVVANNKLTKGDIINGVTIAGQMKAFFGNTSMVQSQYILNIDKISFANGQSEFVSSSVEALSIKIQNMAQKIKAMYDDSTLLQELYWGSDLGAVIGTWPPASTIFGIHTTAGNFVAALGMIENFQNLFDNEAIAQADYFATVVKWNVV